jgi:hypothetical protein
MTGIQSGFDEPASDPLNDRHLAECRCPMDCGGLRRGVEWDVEPRWIDGPHA